VGENEIYIALPEGNAAVAPAATSVNGEGVIVPLDVTA
jgi:hypothetical protein